MREEFRGFSKVFSFTFRQQMKSKGYRATTLAIALALFLIPAIILSGIAISDAKEVRTPEQPGGITLEEGNQNDETGQEGEEEIDSSFDKIKRVFVVGIDSLTSEKREQLAITQLADFMEKNAEQKLSVDVFSGSFDEAAEKTKGTKDTLLLIVSEDTGYFDFSVVVPPKSGLSTEGAVVFGHYLDEYMESLNNSGENPQASGDNDGDVAVSPAQGESIDSKDSEDSDQYEKGKSLADVLSMIISYLNIMVLYFVVLLYGQGVASSVVMEKSSKLMEVFLVSVKPTAMILGKLLAIALCGMIQLGSWIIGLILGLSAGTLVQSIVVPEETPILLEMISLVRTISTGMFTVPGFIMAFILALMGILLYCALASIGGALASKEEDLSSSNVLFVMILIVSFFANLLSGSLGGLDSGAVWAEWIPFTSVLITPARILLGGVSTLRGICYILIVAVTTLILTLVGGKLYKAMALYRGEIPSPKRVIEMIKEK